VAIVDFWVARLCRFLCVPFMAVASKAALAVPDLGFSSGYITALAQRSVAYRRPTAEIRVREVRGTFLQ
jgi:hypothetical protein